MTIYVGRWDLLPEEWEGRNGFDTKDHWDIAEEVSREKRHAEDKFIGEYTAEEFEDAFNHGLTQFIDSRNYWIIIFE